MPPKGQTKRVDCGHDDRSHYAHGMCRNCYLSWNWERKSPEWKFNKSRKHRLKWSYGLTVEQFNAMVIAQDGKCGICHEPVTDRWCVDHDHKTEKVRSLCHTWCNAVVGIVEKRRDMVELAMKYLDETCWDGQTIEYKETT